MPFLCKEPLRYIQPSLKNPEASTRGSSGAKTGMKKKKKKKKEGKWG